MRFLSIIIILFAVVSNLMADSVTLDGQSDMDDGYTDGLNQTTPRGTETWLFVMCGFSSCTYYGLLKFDLSGVSGNIDSVSLKLRRHKPDQNIQLYFYRIIRNWVETEFTWNIAETGVNWTTAGGDYDATKIDSLTDKGANSYDEEIYCQRGDGGGLTEIIQDWIDGTYDNYGLMIGSGLLESGDTAYIYTSENFNEKLYPRPKLYIEYTPAEDDGITRRKKIEIESMGGNR